MLKPGHTETLEEQCAKKGMRMTEQRRVIAQVIEAAADHPDVEELYRRAAAHRSAASRSRPSTARSTCSRKPGSSPSTISRTAAPASSRIPDEHHDHLIDIRSGKVIEFRNEEIEAIQELIAKRLGYRLVDHRLELYAVPLASRGRQEMIFRTLFFIFVFMPVLIVGIPMQFVITRLGLFWNVLTMLFHKLGCIFLGLRVHTIGEPLHGRPTLLLSNHISWTDIIAIGSVADVTFVAKTGVRNTFFVGFMASLQRTLYVDYNRRSDAKRTSREMGKRLASNGAVLLFAEGHRDLGTHVQPFRSALVGAAQEAMAEGGAKDVAIQPVTIAYTHLQGLPVSRNERSGISGMNARGFRAGGRATS